MDAATIQALKDAQNKMIEMFPPQSLVGRTMRAFQSGGNILSSTINMVSSLFKGSKYRGGQYLLGEKYMLYVLGIDIHDRKKVPDEMVAQAMDFFSAILGVPITDFAALEELKQDIELYKKNRPEGKDKDPLTLQKAKEFLNILPWNNTAGAWQSALQSMAESDTSQAGIASEIQSALGIAPGSGASKWVLPVIAILVLLFIIRLFKSK